MATRVREIPRWRREPCGASAAAPARASGAGITHLADLAACLVNRGNRGRVSTRSGTRAPAERHPPFSSLAERGTHAVPTPGRQPRGGPRRQPRGGPGRQPRGGPGRQTLEELPLDERVNQELLEDHLVDVLQ